MPTTATRATLDEIKTLISHAQRPLIIAGGAFDKPGGRGALLAFAEAWHIPVAVSFRRHDLFPNRHPLYVGDLGLANPARQIEAFQSSDLILALGTRLDDITSQGFSFPNFPQPKQTLIHCYPDDHAVGVHFAPEIGLVCDPATLAGDLTPIKPTPATERRKNWSRKLNGIFQEIAAWKLRASDDGVDFAQVVHALSEHAPQDAIVCLDAGTFAAPVYAHFPFVYPQRLMAPLSGAMGYGTPAAVAAQLRYPKRKIICLVGDGGFMMTGNEMIAAIQRKLPILFILSNNHCYASIRLHQDRFYPGRHIGTSLFNPNFSRIANAFDMQTYAITRTDQIEPAIKQGLAIDAPYFIEVKTRLAAAPPITEKHASD